MSTDSVVALMWLVPGPRMARARGVESNDS